MPYSSSAPPIASMTWRPTARQKSARLCSGSSERTAGPKRSRANAAVRATSDARASLKTPCSFHERLVEGPASPRPGWVSASTSNGRHPGPSTVPLSTRTTTAASLREANRLKQAGGPSGSAVPHCGRWSASARSSSAAARAASGPSGSSTIFTPVPADAATPPFRPGAPARRGREPPPRRPNAWANVDPPRLPIRHLLVTAGIVTSDRWRPHDARGKIFGRPGRRTGVMTVP